ncbi:uncharacterized protein Dvar_53160 [Desulfosarcina variabilis str. Montpellier]
MLFAIYLPFFEKIGPLKRALKNSKTPIIKHDPHPRFRDYIQGYWTINCSEKNLNEIDGIVFDASCRFIEFLRRN